MASSVTIARDGSNPPGRITRFPRRPNIQWAGIRRNDKPSPRRGTGEWARAEYCMVQDPSRPSVRALVSAELLALSRQVALGTTARGCNSRPPKRQLSRSPPTRTSTATVITTATLTRNHQHGAPPVYRRGCFVCSSCPARIVRQEASSADSSIVADWRPAPASRCHQVNGPGPSPDLLVPLLIEQPRDGGYQRLPGVLALAFVESKATSPRHRNASKATAT